MNTSDCRTHCWFCGGRMIWQSDFDFEDYGREGDGIVAVLLCTECGAVAEFYTNEEEEEEK